MGDAESVCVCAVGAWGKERGSPALPRNFSAASSLGFILLWYFKKKKILFPSLCLLPAQLVIDPDSLHM